MVIKMTAKNYLVVSEITNVVDNLVLWDGNPNTWQPPAQSLMLVRDTTNALVWGLNAEKTDYVLVSELGAGQIGFTWDGTNCITNESKPEPPQPQPAVSGTQTL